MKGDQYWACMVNKNYIIFLFENSNIQSEKKARNKIRNVINQQHNI